MFTVKSLELLKSLPLRHKEENGEYEMALVEDEQKVYQYKDGEWVEYTSPRGLTISLMELNSMAITQLSPLTDEEIVKAKLAIKKFASFGYYMLLSNELKYYTVFDFNKNYTKDNPRLIDEVVACLQDLGEIKSYDINDDSIEFWITKEDKSYPLYFFDYSGGVIKCR